MGDANSFAGFASDGELRVRSHRVTLRDRDRAILGTLTEIGSADADGTLAAPNGIVLPSGKVLVGRGRVEGRITQALDSLIAADGNLELGDGASPSGFVSEGELEVGPHTVVLRDADRAVLGSLTSLGDATTDGLLRADKGLLLDVGKTLVGRGRIETTVGDFENRGLVDGEVVFASPVTGSGSFGGSITFGASYRVGGAAALIPFDNVAFLDTGSLHVRIGGTDRGTAYDAIDASGMASLDGTLVVTLVDLGSGRFVPRAGDAFRIVSAGSLAGDFNLVAPPLANDLHWSLEYGEETGATLKVVTPYSADFDGDGKVDAGDYGVWEDAFLLSSFGEADADGDGDTDGDDFLAWQRQLGGGIAPSASASTPEPSSCLLAVMALWSFGRRFPRLHIGS